MIFFVVVVVALVMYPHEFYLLHSLVLFKDLSLSLTGNLISIEF